MELSKEHFFIIAFALLVLANKPIASQAKETNLLDYTVVSVKNDIQSENITIHCYSTEDNLGTLTLSYGANYTWHFNINVGRSTKFWCDFKTTHGSGNYGVYTPKLHVRCDYQCNWLIRAKWSMLGAE
ncbi:hypothetical protein PHJA_002361500 [Phtheirospermum japonicum]|uniref:S-protein homolog n=1 Tax=Phtheirospermum japonicum TaxID=374723 RepID=A0A830D4U1_9LAMI|nr:hypothetical protein PHJA_002361500 [Phtheirospermum japonicum]